MIMDPAFIFLYESGMINQSNINKFSSLNLQSNQFTS